MSPKPSARQQSASAKTPKGADAKHLVASVDDPTSMAIGSVSEPETGVPAGIDMVSPKPGKSVFVVLPAGNAYRHYTGVLTANDVLTSNGEVRMDRGQEVSEDPGSDYLLGMNSGSPMANRNRLAEFLKIEVSLKEARADLKALGYKLTTKAGSMFTSGTVVHMESGVKVSGTSVYPVEFCKAHQAFFDYAATHRIVDDGWRTII